MSSSTTVRPLRPAPSQLAVASAASRAPRVPATALRPALTALPPPPCSFAGVQRYGQKWHVIADFLPGRSANAVRNRYLRQTSKLNQEGGAMQPVAAALVAAPALVVAPAALGEPAAAPMDPAMSQVRMVPQMFISQ